MPQTIAATPGEVMLGRREDRTVKGRGGEQEQSGDGEVQYLACRKNRGSQPARNVLGLGKVGKWGREALPTTKQGGENVLGTFPPCSHLNGAFLVMWRWLGVRSRYVLAIMSRLLARLLGRLTTIS